MIRLRQTFRNKSADVRELFLLVNLTLCTFSCVPRSTAHHGFVAGLVCIQVLIYGAVPAVVSVTWMINASIIDERTDLVRWAPFSHVHIEASVNRHCTTHHKVTASTVYRSNTVITAYMVWIVKRYHSLLHDLLSRSYL